MDRLFVDIDTQFDFLDPAGKLYVPGAEQIHSRLERLFAFASRSQIPVLSSADDHAPDDPEFARFPPHCVRGTPGQKKLAITTMPRSITIHPDDDLPDGAVALLADHDQLIFAKDANNVFTNPHFAGLIDELQVGEFIVFGVAFDVCVLDAARGLLERGRRVKIVRDATRALSAEGEAEARRVLSLLGAAWAETAEVVGNRS